MQRSMSWWVLGAVLGCRLPDGVAGQQAGGLAGPQVPASFLSRLFACTCS